jgi:ankyrin repeat protein
MTGDLENVKLLLARGADPSGSAVADAVTFGYADVVRALVMAGANTGIVESTGINLLHWAVITNRPAVISTLVESGVDVNAADDFGFTPLMYATTIDFGDTEPVKELLKAGADRKIKNYEGRTALDQARRYKHADLGAALR